MRRAVVDELNSFSSEFLLRIFFLVEALLIMHLSYRRKQLIVPLI